MQTTGTIRTGAYFDGERYFDDGPYLVKIEQGLVRNVARGDEPPGEPVTFDVPFMMPGLVEAHAHLCLNGGEVDLDVRSRHMKAPVDVWLETGEESAAKTMNHGITLVRDAGDRAGVNDAMRERFNPPAGYPITIRSPGSGLRKPGRYGSFIAREVDTDEEISAAIETAAGGADDLKIIETGIIDFQSGTVKGKPQFDQDQLTRIVGEAHARGLKTFAHCSGVEGLDVSLASGVDSIEHGFFIERRHLEIMADKQISWVPTFSPVHFQWERPELAGWDREVVDTIRTIVDGHLEHVAMAGKLGVPVVAGSDAGSHGVDHGKGLVDELFFFLQAGLSMAETLKSATSRPRRQWELPAASFETGAVADFVLLAGDPFVNERALWSPVATILGEVGRQIPKAA